MELFILIFNDVQDDGTGRLRNYAVPMFISEHVNMFHFFLWELPANQPHVYILGLLWVMPPNSAKMTSVKCTSTHDIPRLKTLRWFPNVYRAKSKQTNVTHNTFMDRCLLAFLDSFLIIPYLVLWIHSRHSLFCVSCIYSGCESLLG